MAHRITRRLLALGVAGLLVSAPMAHAATLTVTTASDADAVDGGCSLREAILAINAGTDRNECTGTGYGNDDRIHFAIPGTGVHDIGLTSNLPPVTRTVTIDGTSQPGADCGTWPPALRIGLDGLGLRSIGIHLANGSDGSLVRGLAVGNVGAIEGGTSAAILVGSDDNRIECNLVGLRANGAPWPNVRGIEIQSASRNIIGTDGTEPAIGRRNLVSNNHSGIVLRGTAPSGNVVGGNFIGVDATGLELAGNQNGIHIEADPVAPGLDNVIGYAGTGIPGHARNVISGNSSSGIRLSSGAVRTRIAANLIGLGGDGKRLLGNELGVFALVSASVTDTLIGFPASQSVALAGNVISANSVGVQLYEGSAGEGRVYIIGNLFGLDAFGQQTGPSNQQFHAVFLDGEPKMLLRQNVIADHVEAVLLQFHSADAVLNGVTLPGGTEPLDSSSNCISLNDIGFQMMAGPPVTFANNYWGAATGPSGGHDGDGDWASASALVDPFLTSAPANCDLSKVAGLRVALQGVTTPLYAGDSATAVVAVENQGPGVAEDVVVQVDMPAGVTAATIPMGCSATASGLTCDIADIAPGTTQLVLLDLQLDADAAGTVVLRAAATSGSADPVLDDNQDSVAREVVRLAEVAVDLSHPDEVLGDGATTEYMLRVRNTGPASVSDYLVTMAASSGLANLWWTCEPQGGASCPESGTGAVVARLTLPSGGLARFTISAQVGGPGPVSLSASGTMPDGTTDFQPANDFSEVSHEVAVIHDVALRFEADASQVRVGQYLDFRLVVSNAGPTHANGVVLLADLPPTVSDLLWTCTGYGSTCVGPAGSGTLPQDFQLLADTHVVVEASVRVDALEPVLLEGFLSIPGDTLDPDATNNGDLLEIEVVPSETRVFGDGFENSTGS